jgi:putative transposase
MNEINKKNRRCSIRLREYDYSQFGAYFVTVCVQNRKCLFGHIGDEKMALNDIGEMVQKWWYEMPNKFTNIELGEFMIMPNHLHGIIQIVGADLCV